MRRQLLKIGYFDKQEMHELAMELIKDYPDQSLMGNNNDPRVETLLSQVNECTKMMVINSYVYKNASKHHRYNDVEDIAQIVTLKIADALHFFRGKSQFTTWLNKIVTNDILTNCRKKSAISFSNAFPNNEEEDTIASLHSREIGPEEQLLSSMDCEAQLIKYTDAKNNLSPKHRKVWELRHEQGNSYKEIADKMDMNIGTVRSRLSRVRSVMHEQMGDSEYGFDAEGVAQITPHAFANR